MTIIGRILSIRQQQWYLKSWCLIKFIIVSIQCISIKTYQVIQNNSFFIPLLLQFAQFSLSIMIQTLFQSQFMQTFTSLCISYIFTYLHIHINMLMPQLVISLFDLRFLKRKMLFNFLKSRFFSLLKLQLYCNVPDMLNNSCLIRMFLIVTLCILQN